MLGYRFGRAGVALVCTLVVSGCGSAAHDAQLASARVQAGGASLSPNPAVAGMPIVTVLGDRVVNPANCQYEWRRNGSLIPNAAGRALEPSHFSKGDAIYVTVHVPGTTAGSPQTLNAEVRVVNSPPKITRVTLAMTATSTGAQLMANPEVVDPDGDAPTFAYQWFRNDHRIEGATAASLPATQFARGDHVAVEVVASDDASPSPPYRSDGFSIDNRPPQFSSQPYAPKKSDTLFHYQAVAADPDGDALHYELVRGPDGMTVAPDGTVSWTLPTAELRHGDYPVRVRAIDAKGGEAVQDFTIHLDAPTSKP